MIELRLLKERDEGGSDRYVWVIPVHALFSVRCERSGTPIDFS